jgi:uncharacterized membrane protein (DUF373 family)
MAIAHDSNPKTWARIVRLYERIVIFVLMALLMVVIGIATVELGWLLIGDLATTRRVVLDVEEMFELFGFFLLVLIGVELLTSLKSYITEGVVHVEVVLEVALIAIAQKIIILDSYRAGAASMLSQAALILALAVSFWLVRAARLRKEGGSS